MFFITSEFAYNSHFINEPECIRLMFPSRSVCPSGWAGGGSVEQKYTDRLDLYRSLFIIQCYALHDLKITLA
jgi:hypothetical protein